MRYDLTSVPERYHSSRALASVDVDHWVSLVQEVLPRATSTLLVDLGCGTGRFTVPLAEQLGVSVIGIDPSQKMLREAARNTSSPHVAYQEGSAESTPLKTSVATLMFMSNAIHHVKILDGSVAGNAQSAPIPWNCVHPKLLSRKSGISSLPTVFSRSHARLPTNDLAA